MLVSVRVFHENLEFITCRNVNSFVGMESQILQDPLILDKEWLHLAHGVLRLLMVFLFEVFQIFPLLIYLVEIGLKPASTEKFVSLHTQGFI